MGGSQVLSEYDFCDVNVLDRANNNSTNGANGTTPPKGPSTSNTTLPPFTSTALQRGKMDQKDWRIIEWFGCSVHWQDDFAKWIILVLEERQSQSSEQKDIETGSNIIKKEIEEISDAGMMDSESYEICLDLITKCRNVRSNFNIMKREELLRTIFNHLQTDINEANTVLDTLGKLSVEQRTILRFMTHQKVQARIAFLRTTLKVHEEGYHCITNPYYEELRKQKQMVMNECEELQTSINVIKASNTKLNNQYSDLNREYSDTIFINKELSSENEKILATNQELNKENNTLKGQLQAKNDDLSKLCQYDHIVKGENEKILVTNQELSKENNALKGQLQAKNEELSKLYQYDHMVKGENEKILVTNHELNKENNALKEQLRAKNDELSELCQEYDETVNLNKELSGENEKVLVTSQELNKENNALKEQLRAKNEELSELCQEYDETANLSKELSGENVKILVTNKELNKEINTLKEQLRAKNELLLTKTQQITQKEKDESDAKGIYTRIAQERDEMKSEYEASIKQLLDEAEKSRKYSKRLQDEAEELRKYAKQAALGNVTNIRWSDSTLNNPIQLTKDIEKFQHTLADFTKVKGRSFKVDEDAAKQLLTSYGCNANLNNTREIKNYLTAALQRMILEIIFNSAENLYNTAKYANHADSDELLESLIMYHTQWLIKNTNTLITNREGKDNVTAVTPIKIRQQVYAALGSRGFAKSKHPFIKDLVREILGKMERYREVVDEDKKIELRSDAENIIRDGMQLWFSLKAQEPIPEICWFKSGDPLEVHLMVGSWENENAKKMVVDFTIFPLIINEHDNQIFNKAQVYVRPKQKGKVSYTY